MHRAIASATNLLQDRALKSQNKPSNCPWCGSRRIAIVLGGMPVYIPEMEEELADGDSAIVEQPGDQAAPSWQCTECGAQFFREFHLVNNQD